MARFSINYCENDTVNYYATLTYYQGENKTDTLINHRPKKLYLEQMQKREEITLMEVEEQAGEIHIQQKMKQKSKNKKMKNSTILVEKLPLMEWHWKMNFPQNYCILTTIR